MKRALVITLLLLASLIAAALYLIGASAEDATEQRRAYAIARMVTGLVVIWIWIGGAVMYRYRDAIRAWVLAIPLNWRVKFVLFATALACAEEAVTVTMTNLAPMFGSRIGEAYITASANYLDVILFHSVVVFIPYFIVQAALLARYAFGPLAIFLSFGLVGTTSEAIFAGNLGAFVMFPVWVFVYGLMVWLPCYCLPQDRGAQAVGWGRILSCLGHIRIGAADDPAHRLCHHAGSGASGHRLCALRHGFDVAHGFGVDGGGMAAYCGACADGWVIAGGNLRGKSGLHEARVPGNARRGQPQGKRHREESAAVPGL